VARNARFVGSELDLVVKKGRTLAVVEVKARRSAVAVDPAALLPRRKLVSLRRGALALLSRERFDVDTVRLDLAVVTRRMRDGAVATHVDYRAGISWPEP
jgi:Holliday junction resolvase-like predicted endonuclease